MIFTIVLSLLLFAGLFFSGRAIMMGIRQQNTTKVILSILAVLLLLICGYIVLVQYLAD